MMRGATDLAAGSGEGYGELGDHGALADPAFPREDQPHLFYSSQPAHSWRRCLRHAALVSVTRSNAKNVSKMPTRSLFSSQKRCMRLITWM